MKEAFHLKERKKYVDSCRTLEILKQDSGLLPKPRLDWNTFEPKEGDLAHVDEDGKDYLFDGKEWQPVEDKEEEANQEAPEGGEGGMKDAG